MVLIPAARPARAGLPGQRSRAAGSAPPPAATRIVFFGPDLNDAAFRRRVSQWRHAGFEALAFAFSRTRSTAQQLAQCVDLGHVAPQSRLGRLFAMALAGLRIFRARRSLQGAHLFVARNLDNLLLALVARWMARVPASIVYEVLDINPSCTAPGWRGRLFRAIEKWIMSNYSDLLVVSSPRFIDFYYERVLKYPGPWFLFENKVPKYAALQFDAAMAPPAGRRAGDRWRIGWFGYLDDERSWQCLRALAEAFPEDVEIYVRGLPYGNFDLLSFLADLGRLPNATYGGGFANPDDLMRIYGAVDLVWSIDCNDLSANSKWLLTNSVYEALYMGKPVIALQDTAVGAFVETCRAGWCLGEPIEDSLQRFIGGLTAAAYEAKLAAIADLDPALFTETDEIHEIWSLLQPQAGDHAVPLAGDPARAAAPPPGDGYRTIG